MMPDKYTLTLTPADVQIIYAALQKRPYEEVVNLVNDFAAQVRAQEADKPPPAKKK